MDGRGCGIAFALLGVMACPREPVEPDGTHEPPPEEACAEETQKPLPAAAGAIYSGTRRPSLMPLSGAQQEAVVALSDVYSYEQYGAFCSGTLISDDVVLTAQHCTDGYGDSDVAVLFGRDDLAPSLMVPSVEVFEHDSLDIALVRLASIPALQIDVAPIAAAFEPPRDEDIGTLVENAGYGETDDWSHGRYFVTEHYLGVYAVELLVVDGEGNRGVCFGDSGGPMMHLSAQGDVRVLGVLSFGDNPCGTIDYFQRVDTVLPWLEAIAGEVPLGGPVPCGDDVTEAGACSSRQALATYCQDGVVVHDSCAVDEICGDRALPDGSVGKRCVRTEDNACGDVSFFGRCEDDVLSWCDDGVVRERFCGACQGRCLLVDDVVGYACVPSDCRGIDELGMCDGSVSRWCEGTTLVSEDCADDDQTCQWVGPELGFYCYDEQACDGLDFYGECDGSVVHWCQDNEPMSYDCADEGRACGLVDADTGFNCIDPEDP